VLSFMVFLLPPNKLISSIYIYIFIYTHACTHTHTHTHTHLLQDIFGSYVTVDNRMLCSTYSRCWNVSCI
jgi:hypothetical protein